MNKTYCNFVQDYSLFEKYNLQLKVCNIKKAREEYIKWNKPMYSLKDVQEAEHHCNNAGQDLISTLIELGRK